MSEFRDTGTSTLLGGETAYSVGGSFTDQIIDRIFEECRGKTVEKIVRGPGAKVTITFTSKTTSGEPEGFVLEAALSPYLSLLVGDIE
jgi:hypothetical protein